MGDQALVQLAGEYRDAVHSRVVPEPVAGHADLATAGLEQGALIEIGPLVYGDIQPCAERCRAGERVSHDSESGRTPVLARFRLTGCSGFAGPPRPRSAKLNAPWPAALRF